MNKFISLTDVTLRQSSPHGRVQRLLESLWTVYAEEKLQTLAYMATSGGHFSRPLGMGGYRSYSG